MLGRRQWKFASLHVALMQLASMMLLACAGTSVLLDQGPLGDVVLIHGYPLIAVLYSAAGIIAWWRRPENRLGALMTVAGATWLVAGLQNTGVPLLIAAGLVVSSVPLAVVVHLMHAYPSGRLSGSASRWAVGVAYAAALLLQVPQWAFTPTGPPFDLLTISPRADLALAGYRAQVAVCAAVVVVTAYLLVLRLRTFGTGHRRLLSPLLAYGVLAVVTPPLSVNFLRPVGGNQTAIGRGAQRRRSVLARHALRSCKHAAEQSAPAS